MTRIVSPPRDQLDKLRQKLESGEKLVFDFFDQNLPEEWEIYIQPHLNGLRPDFVLLNPKVGIAVFEIKDWNLNAMEYWLESRENKAPRLMAMKDGKKFSKQKDNPVDKVLMYKKEIHELYCPRLEKRAGFAAITAGVIFPFASDNQVRGLLYDTIKYRGLLDYYNYHPISGSDSLNSNNLASVFPESRRMYSKCMSEEMADDIRSWLVEPDFAATQRLPLELDANQKSFVNSRTATGYRRIKGAAGSGKSLILAARAAKLLGEGKKVLVVTYNITLMHYLKDLAVRWPVQGGKVRQDITWLNFHYWCKRTCIEADCEEEYKLLWAHSESDDATEDVLNNLLPGLVARIIDNDTDDVVSRYDAVLVDEGQDFRLSWWDVLRKVCKPDGEMLLVADATQDIYGTANAWTDDAMKGAGFRGGWSELKISYRLPPKALDKACEFAEMFLPKDLIDLPKSPQGELDIYPCILKWVDTTPQLASDICKQEVLGMSPSASPELLAIPDITFLSSNQKFGIEVVGNIGKEGVKTVHTYSEDSSQSRRKKMGFYMGDARIKATTLHSFKGWEGRALVIYIGEKVDKKSLALIYTGLTRLKRHMDGSYLTIVNCCSELTEFGKSWDEYENKIK